MRIAVSQRADNIAHRGERRDALDQRWAQRLESLGLVAVPLPNGLQDPQAWARALGIEGLLLSGGNDVGGAAPERDRSETLLLDLARADGWPVLGVCRGLQMINVHLGGRLTPLTGHVAMRHDLRHSGETASWLAVLPDTLQVNSFHGFGISASGLAAPLVPVMCDAQGFVEAAEHRELPWVGVMWHPEREPLLGAVDRTILNTVFRSS